MDDTGIGWAPAALGAVLVVGLGVFLLACRLSAGEPVPPPHARHVARWRRAAPWVFGAAVAVAVLNAVWVLLSA